MASALNHPGIVTIYDVIALGRNSYPSDGTRHGHSPFTIL